MLSHERLDARPHMRLDSIPGAILPINSNGWLAGYTVGWSAHERQTKLREDQLCQSIARLERENAELHDEISSLRLSNSILGDD